MSTSTRSSEKFATEFPPFDLVRLLDTVFKPKKGEKLCILIDLEDPRDVENFVFLKNPKLQIQKKAYEVFYKDLNARVAHYFNLGASDFFAYQITGGSNLELPETAIDPKGALHRLNPDIYSHYDIILCITTFSATAPLTAAAKKFGFRGATMHGMNETIIKTGLSVDYNQVSAEAERFRQGMTKADWVEIDFEVEGRPYQLRIDLGRQEAQKSHGLCREGHEIANLPAGEVYFVPISAKGSFPIKFEEDGTLGLMHVEEGKISRVELLKGDQKIIQKYQSKFNSDPASAILGELGFGTQMLPYAKADIQDEKIFGTFHLATGRNDHLNGLVTKDSFKSLSNATHNDILFSSTKTPEIHVHQVRMKKGGEVKILIEGYRPASYLLDLR